MLWPFIFGYCYSILVGLLIELVTVAMCGGEEGKGWRTRIQGSVEQVLYTSSILNDQSTFIAVWLGVKTAAHWHRWKLKQDESELFDKYLSPYLVGNALSVIVGVTGAQIVRWGNTGHYFFWLAPSFVGLGVVFLYFWADHRSKTETK